jgi:hypothetical protein
LRDLRRVQLTIALGIYAAAVALAAWLIHRRERTARRRSRALGYLMPLNRKGNP